MNPMTSDEVRPLTARELDEATGGMNAKFSYGGVMVEIYADANGYSAAATNGSFTYEITQY